MAQKEDEIGSPGLPTCPDELPPVDPTHPAANPDVHIPVEEYRTPTMNRFIDKIKVLEETGCWEWQAHVGDNGYGRFWFRDGAVNAHHAAFDMFVPGGIPDGTEVIRHRCPRSSKTCCAPSHLNPGTHSENARDAIEDGTGNNDLDADDVLDIRRRAATGAATGVELAEEYNTTRANISKIINRESWTHLDPVEVDEDDREDSHPETKLVASDVLEIRRRYWSGDANGKDLADEYGVSPSNISLIVNRETWTHLDPVDVDEDD